MYEINFSEKSKRQLKKLDKITQYKIKAVIDRLSIRPFSHDIRRLEGTRFYRARAGKYRIIMDIIKKKLIIYVIEVGPRHKIYK